MERLYGCQYDIQVGYDLVPVRGFPNVDYFNSGTSFVLLKNGEKRKNITIQLVKSSSLNQKSFLVNLTSVWQREEVYKGKRQLLQITFVLLLSECLYFYNFRHF